MKPKVSVSSAAPKVAIAKLPPENADERRYASAGSQSAPTSRIGGSTILPRERRAIIKSASATIAPAPTMKALVEENATAFQGVTATAARMRVIRIAQVLRDSSVR